MNILKEPLKEIFSFLKISRKMDFEADKSYEDIAFSMLCKICENKNYAKNQVINANFRNDLCV